MLGEASIQQLVGHVAVLRDLVVYLASEDEELLVEEVRGVRQPVALGFYFLFGHFGVLPVLQLEVELLDVRVCAVRDSSVYVKLPAPDVQRAHLAGVRLDPVRLERFDSDYGLGQPVVPLRKGLLSAAVCPCSHWPAKLASVQLSSCCAQGSSQRSLVPAASSLT